MRIYDVTTDCLVDDCLIHWYITARNEKEAWAKGYNLALRSNVADSGCVDCKRLKNIPSNIKLTK